MNNEFELLFKLLREREKCGIKTLERGTELICSVPLLAPKAWLHTIYAKLSDEQINSILKDSIIEFPEDYIEFLKRANGINVFSDNLSIWGLRTSYSREGDDSVQPYDVLALNEEEIRKSPNGWFYFGSYSWDGSEMLYDLKSDNKKVYRCLNGSKNVIQEWADLWTWLSSEIERISKLFDDNGYEYDENVPTVPSE